MSNTRKQIAARLGIAAHPGAKAKMARWTLDASEGWGDLSKQWTATINGTQWAIVVEGATGNGSLMRVQPGRAPQTIKRGSVEQLKRYAETLKSSRPGAKATFASVGHVVKEDAQYIYYYPEEDDRATFADTDGKGAYTVKSNRTGKPVSAKTYRSWNEANSASNAMNEKLPPLKKRKGFSRLGKKAKMGKYWVEDEQSKVKQPVKSMREGIERVSGMQNGVLRYSDQGMTSILAYGRGSGGVSLTEDGKLHKKFASSRPGAKAKMAAPTAAQAKEAQRAYVRGMIAKLKGEWHGLDNQPSLAGRAVRMKAIEEQIAQLEARLKSMASRPGVKAVMAAAPGVAELERLYAKFQESTRLFTPNKYRDASEQKRMTSGQKKDFAFFENLLKAARSGDGKRAKAMLAKTDSLLTAHFVPKELRVWAAQFAAHGAKAKMGKPLRIGAEVAVDYKGETVRGQISSLVANDPPVYMVSIRSKNVKVKRSESEIKQHFPKQDWLGNLMSRPGAKAKMRRMTQQEQSHLRAWIAQNFRTVDEMMEATDKMEKTFESDSEHWESRSWPEVAKAAGVWSRPGAKAKFDGPFTQQQEARLAKREEQLRKQRAKQALEAYKNAVREEDRYAGSVFVTPRRMAELEARTQAAYEEAKRLNPDYKGFSRPGAKATAAKPSDLEREDVKAGLKLMEKADEAVSNKIRTLIAEGKPQDQAVAIALDMKRRGEI
jgi:hypothetical protein